MLVVFCNEANAIPPSSTIPCDAESANVGAGGTAKSAANVPDSPSIHRVSGDSSYDASSPLELAARADTCTPPPILSGTSIVNGLDFPLLPARQEFSATTK